MRNIVSFPRMPARHYFQKVGRALSRLSSTFALGWSFTNLDVACDEFAHRFSELKPNLNDGTDKSSPRTCACCGRPMASPGVCVADAGQAYEALRPTAIYEALSFICDKAHVQKWSRHIYVQHTKKSVTGFGGSIYQTYRDRTVFMSTLSIRRLQPTLA